MQSKKRLDLSSQQLLQVSHHPLLPPNPLKILYVKLHHNRIAVIISCHPPRQTVAGKDRFKGAEVLLSEHVEVYFHILKFKIAR
jgi:hypothetical protein